MAFLFPRISTNNHELYSGLFSFVPISEKSAGSYSLTFINIFKLLKIKFVT